MMGYQPTERPELLYPPGNPNVYCGACSTKVGDDMLQCPKCGRSFPSRLPISPYTDELYDPAWGTVIQKGGGCELLNPKKPPLRKCLQCHQMKREDFTERCQACYAQNKREAEASIEYTESGIPLPGLNRNLMYHPYMTTIPELHDYLWYFLKWLARGIVAFLSREGGDLDSTQYGGRSNSTLLTLMKSIESEIEARSEPQGEYDEPQAVYPDWRRE